LPPSKSDKSVPEIRVGGASLALPPVLELPGLEVLTRWVRSAPHGLRPWVRRAWYLSGGTREHWSHARVRRRCAPGVRGSEPCGHPRSPSLSHGRLWTEDRHLSFYELWDKLPPEGNPVTRDSRACRSTPNTASAPNPRTRMEAGIAVTDS